MNEVLQAMLKGYPLDSTENCENAVKEIVQEIVLLGLWRAKFFEHAAFYGGTALRILHRLNRYSEDLDFSLLKPDRDFQLRKYHQAVSAELISLGFEADVESISKHDAQNIDSSFVKLNTAKHFLIVSAPQELVRRIHHQANIKVKFEIDIDPPLGFSTEGIQIFRPAPFTVRTYTLPNLFAGKLSAVLCRKWVHRVKGRDWFDLIWFVASNIPVHMGHLRQRLLQSEFIKDASAFDKQALVEGLNKKLDGLDLEAAMADVRPFLKDKRQMDGWSKDLFKAVIERIEVTPN